MEFLVGWGEHTSPRRVLRSFHYFDQAGDEHLAYEPHISCLVSPTNAFQDRSVYISSRHKDLEVHLL